MSTYAAPDAVGAPPGLGGPPGAGVGPPPGPDGGNMAMLAALLGAGGGAGGPGLGLPGPGLPGGDPGAGGPGQPDGLGDVVSGMSAIDHIQAAMKHLMMAMTQTQDEQQAHGVVRGMGALQGILAGHAKNKATVAAAGG
jgi:hypothetical protein